MKEADSLRMIGGDDVEIQRMNMGSNADSGVGRLRHAGVKAPDS